MSDIPTFTVNPIGIQTIGELANADVTMLKAMFKKHGEILWNFANGRDVSEVEAEPPENKGYGNTTTSRILSIALSNFSNFS